jgi:hypothetical protein
MSRRRAVLTVGIVLGLIAIAWWLFGFSTHRIVGSKMTLHRFFGRVTRIDSEIPVEGKTIRERLLFSWSKPWVNFDPLTDCAAIFPEVWQDRNGDGKWDTWLRRVGPDAKGHCQVEYQVDTTLSGKPDWTFVLDYGDYKKADAMIKARRGF